MMADTSEVLPAPTAPATPTSSPLHVWRTASHLDTVRFTSKRVFRKVPSSADLVVYSFVATSPFLTFSREFISPFFLALPEGFSSSISQARVALLMTTL